MPNTTIGHYDIYRAMGRTHEEASRLVGVNGATAAALQSTHDGAGGVSLEEIARVASGMDEESPYTPAQAAMAMSLTGMVDSFHKAHPMGIQNVEAPWYKKVLKTGIEGAIVVGDTLATPQQLMWQGIMEANGGEGDWREAIPEWAAPDDWKEQGVEHKLVDVGDVLDDYIGGKYHTLLQGLDKKGGIAKYGGGWGLKTAEFLVDVALDPMNVIAGAGIGKHMTKAMRATLPTEVQARMAGRAALKSRQLVDLEDASKLQAKWVSELETKALTEPSEQVGKHLALAKSRQQFIDDEVAYMKTLANSDGVTIELPPVNKTTRIDEPELADFATKEEYRIALAAWEAQEQIGKVYSEPLQFRDLDPETLLRRIAFGPDDTEMLTAALHKIVAGEDPKNLLIRGILDNVAPTSTSLEIAIAGIGKNGMVTRELASSVELMGEIAELRKTGIAQTYKMREALKVARKEAAAAAKPKVDDAILLALKGKVFDLTNAVEEAKNKVLGATGDTQPALDELKKLSDELAAAKDELAEASKPAARLVDDVAKKAADKKVKDIEGELDLLSKRDKAQQAEMKGFQETGEWSAKAQDVGIKAPSGPRRNIFEAADMDENYNFGHKMLTKMAYPGAYMPTLNWGLGSRFFREPMRVLESHLPGGWEIIRGGAKAKDAFVKGTQGKLRRIYADAGVVEHEVRARKIKKSTNVDIPLRARVNKQRDEMLGRLLDAEVGTEAYDALAAQADDRLLKAAGEIREMLDEIAPRLGLSPGQKIAAYFPHIAPDKWFEKGAMPQEFIGTRSVGGTPWFLKEREDGAGYLLSATEVLDVYTRGVSKYLYTDPSLDMLKKLAAGKAKADPTKSWLVGYADDLIKNVKGEPSVLSQAFEKLGLNTLQDPARRAAGMIGMLTYSAALTGNIRYPIMSLVQTINTTAAEFGVLRTLKGIAAQSTGRGRLYARIAGVADEHLAHFEDIQSAWSGAMAQIRVVSPSISDTESMIRGITFHASLDETLARGGYKSIDDVKDINVLREMFAKASRDTDDVNHIFGTYGKPVAFGRFSRTGSGLATQFMSFPFKQTETIVSNSLKDPGFFVDYLIIAGQMQSIASRANIDVSPFLGFGYADVAKRDQTSLPMDILISGVKAFTIGFDYDATSYEKKEAAEAFKKNLPMLIPLSRVFKNTSTTINEFATGQERRMQFDPKQMKYLGGDLKRELNTNLDDPDPIFDGGSEALSILTRLQSKQKRMQADVDEQKRINKGERRLLAENITRELERHFRDGKGVDMKKVRQLQIELSALGKPFTPGEIVQMIQNEQKAHVLIEYLREDKVGQGETLRTVDDHNFYRGASK